MSRARGGRAGAEGASRRASAAARAGGDRGLVTAEVAAALPAVVLLLAACVAVVQLAGQAVALQGAAGDAARLAARGAGDAAALSRIQQVDAGAAVVVETEGEFACVRATAPARLLGAPFGDRLEARACALDDRAAPW